MHRADAEDRHVGVPCQPPQALRVIAVSAALLFGRLLICVHEQGCVLEVTLVIRATLGSREQGALP